MKNPWKKLSSREIYKNEWLKLREDQVITPSGTAGIYGVVETHPALTIIPLTADLQTYLVGQFRYTLNVYSWEVPEGGGNEGETLLEGAKRELLEETGLLAKNWTELGTAYTSNSFTDEIGYIFLAQDLTQKAPQPDNTEDLQIKKIPFMDAYEMVLNGEIKDSLAFIGITRTYHWLKNRGMI
jgi:8-oxo-dGTP pyrophosphatase MutT (NUDIX family)